MEYKIKKALETEKKAIRKQVLRSKYFIG